MSVCFSKEFCISTYNVENLFDGISQGTEYREFVPSKYGWSKEEAEYKFQNTLKVLKNINSDIYALQEVENEEIVIQLKKELGFNYHVFSKNTNTSVGLALISKYPIVEYFSYTLKGYDRFRPILYANVKIDDEQIGFWINHWPSLKNDEKTRLAYAKSLRYYINKKQDDFFIALGDFNTPHEFDSIVDKNLDDLLYDPWMEISQKKRWSHVYKGSYDALDRILISNSMLNSNSFNYIKGSFTPHKESYLLNSRGYPKGNFRGYSDHLPLIACFSNEKDSIKSAAKEVKVLYIDSRVVLVNSDNKTELLKNSGLELKEGYIYDININDNTILDPKKNKGVFDKEDYDKELTNIKDIKDNDILKNIRGVYKNGYIVGDFGKIRFYKISKKPKDNEILYVDRARVQKYNNNFEIIAR